MRLVLEIRPSLVKGLQIPFRREPCKVYQVLSTMSWTIVGLRPDNGRSNCGLGDCNSFAKQSASFLQ